MDAAIIEKIIVNSEKLKEWASQYPKKRYLYEKALGVSGEYFVGICGLRGIGKTVLLLQLARVAENSVYFSADATYLSPYSLYDVVDALRKQGFRNIFIDEIHVNAAWAEDVKTVYDEHDCRLFFSGSSSLKIRQSGADLSRRAIMLELLPVSFREYLNIRREFEIPRYPFEELLANRRDIALKHSEAAQYFDEYMRFGGVLYSGEGFREAVENSIEKIITRDLAALRSISIKYEADVKRLLYHLAASQPYEFSYNSVSQKLGLDKTLLIRMLADLQNVGLLKIVLPCRNVGVDVKKEPKVYLTVPYRCFFSASPERGALREEFFANHAPIDGYYKTRRGEKTPDFKVSDVVVEVGGSSKKAVQNPDVIASEAMVFDAPRAPLFIFGFLY
ncbi:ATP-binding protein [Candidatus Micrarchaeota archaeon]|nr:ATP-binding protein [Candidatus Micrarchaeota archaeon]